MPSRLISQDWVFRFRHSPAAIAATAGAIGLICGAVVVAVFAKPSTNAAVASSPAVETTGAAPSAKAELPQTKTDAPPAAAAKPASISNEPKKRIQASGIQASERGRRLRAAGMALHHAAMPVRARGRPTQGAGDHHRQDRAAGDERHRDAEPSKSEGRRQGQDDVGHRIGCSYGSRHLHRQRSQLPLRQLRLPVLKPAVRSHRSLWSGPPILSCLRTFPPSCPTWPQSRRLRPRPSHRSSNEPRPGMNAARPRRTRETGATARPRRAALRFAPRMMMTTMAPGAPLRRSWIPVRAGSWSAGPSANTTCRPKAGRNSADG